MKWYRKRLLVRIQVALVRFLPENEHDKSQRDFLGFYATNTNVKVGPEPLEKEIQEILLCSKREDRFSNPFFEVVQKTCQVRFSYLLRYGNLFKGLRHCESSRRSARR